MLGLTLKRQYRSVALAPERRAGRGQNDAMFVGLGANIPKWGRDDYDALAREGYSRVSLVYAVINAIATSAAEARVRPMTGDTKKQEEQEDTPLALLLKQPNARQGWYSFGVSYHTTMQYSGNAFIYKQRNAMGIPVGLRVLRTGRMQIEPGDNGEPVMYYHRIGGHDYPIPPKDIIHIKFEDPLDDWFGLSPLHVLARTTQVKVELQKVQFGAFHNGGMMPGILTMDRELDDDEPEEYRRQWRRQFTGIQAGNIAVFGASLKYQQIAMDLDKMAMPEMNYMADSEICSVYQTPPSVVYTLISQRGGSSLGSGGAELQDQRKWWENKLNPEMRLFVEGLTRGLRDDFGEAWELDPDTSKIRALQDDQDALWARALTSLQAGGITHDRYLSMIGEDPIGGRAGKLYRIPINVELKTAEELNEPPPPPPEPVLPLPMPVIHTEADGSTQQQESGQSPRQIEGPRRNPDISPGGRPTRSIDIESRAANPKRDARTAAYAAALLALWRRVQAGEITRQEYDAAVAQLTQTTEAAIISAVAEDEGVDVATVRAGATAGQIATMIGKAMLAASAGAVLFMPGAEPPSDKMANARANAAAGAIWAAEHVAEAGAKVTKAQQATEAIVAAGKGKVGEAVQAAASTATATWNCTDDDASCEDCIALDGQEWAIAAIPQFPGGGETACLGNCRCTLDYADDNGSVSFGKGDFKA